MVSKYTDQERARIVEAAREALELAEISLASPRPEYVPPTEDKLQKWRRQAAEQEQKFARERAEQQAPTDYEVARMQRAELTRMLDQQKSFLLEVVAGALAGMRDEIISHVDQKIAGMFAEATRLADELAGLRRDANAAKAFNKSEGDGVIDLPDFVRKRRRMTRVDMVRREVREIRIAARVAELRRVADDASKHYQQMVRDSGLSEPHFRLRMMLIGRWLPPPRKGE